MSNMFVTKVKEVSKDLHDEMYTRFGEVFGVNKYFITLLEADVERLKDKECVLLKGGLFERAHELFYEINYKQQAIDELKKSI